MLLANRKETLANTPNAGRRWTEELYQAALNLILIYCNEHIYTLLIYWRWHCFSSHLCKEKWQTHKRKHSSVLYAAFQCSHGVSGSVYCIECGCDGGNKKRILDRKTNWTTEKKNMWRFIGINDRFQPH